MSVWSIGIDVGTTSVKASLLQRTDEWTHLVASQSVEHGAYTRGCGLRTESVAQQDVHSILRAIHTALTLLQQHVAAESFSRAAHIGVACQMHGVVMWNDDVSSADVSSRLWEGEANADGDAAVAAASLMPLLSPLVTWQDGRCDAAFLEQLNKSAAVALDPSAPLLSGQRLSSGFGLASLALFASRPSVATPAGANWTLDPAAYTHAGTIGDLLVFLLTAHDGGAGAHVMDHTNAAAWGMYDAPSGQWQLNRVSAANVPVRLLPRLVAPASPVGVLCPLLAERWKLRADLQVHACVGDHPASVYAAALAVDELSIAIGTSSQVCRVDVSKAAAGDSASCSVVAGTASSSVERRPYVGPFSHGTLLLCASLNGGNVLQTFVQGLARAVRDLALAPVASADLEEARIAQQQEHVSALFANLIARGVQRVQQQDSQTLPSCDARFFGERTCPAARGSVSQLAVPLLDPAQFGGGAPALFLSLCRGVITNLRTLIDGSSNAVRASPPAMLCGVRSIRCVGAAMARNPLLSHFVAEVFNVPPAEVRVPTSQQGDADAAHGAAIMALDWQSRLSALWNTQQ